jgi:hypothetical protein
MRSTSLCTAAHEHKPAGRAGSARLPATLPQPVELSTLQVAKHAFEMLI